MKLTNESILKLDEFVETIAEDQYKSQQKFIWEILFGMIASSRVVLADMARTLEPDKRLIHVEKRLSSNLAALRLDEEGLLEAHLEWAAEQVTKDTVISYDIADIVKKREPFRSNALFGELRLHS